MNNSLKLYRKKKIYPKKYVRRYRRYPMYKSVKNADTTNIKCEFYDAIRYTTGGQFISALSSTDYYTVATMFAQSTSFTDIATRYARYRVNGIQYRYEIVLNVPSTAYPELNSPTFAFYPQTTGSSVGSAPLYNDMKFSPTATSTTVQTKYIWFPDNYFQSSNGGYGTWNNMSDYSSIGGQVSFYRSNTFVVPPPSATQTVGYVRITFYITASTKNQ